MREASGFWAHLAGYLWQRKRLWLAPIVVIAVLLLLVAALLVGGSVLDSLYRDF